MPAADVVRDATLEIRTSIVFATVIIVLVFLPIFGLAGVEGRLLTPLAFAYIVALLASLAVAIVVTPALCVRVPAAARASIRARARRLAGADAQGAVRARSCRTRSTIRALVMAASAGAAGRRAASALTRMGTAFLPEFHEGSLTVQANTLPGTSLAKSDEIGRRVEQILLSQPEVVATARRTGRAELDEHVQGVEAAEIDVGLRETGRPRDGAAGRAAPRVLDAAGHERDDRSADLAPHRSHAVGHARQHRGQGVRRRSRHAAAARRARARRRSATVPGVVDLSLEQQMDVPFVRFVLNRSAIARYGLRAGRRRRGHRDELRRRDRRPHLRSRARRSISSSSSTRRPARTSSASPICRSTRRAARPCPIRAAGRRPARSRGRT